MTPAQEGPSPGGRMMDLSTSPYPKYLSLPLSSYERFLVSGVVPLSSYLYLFERLLDTLWLFLSVLADIKLVYLIFATLFLL